MGYDINGLSENFNYNTEIMQYMGAYNSGTFRGGITAGNYQANISFDTDGLNLLWKTEGFHAFNERIIGWNQKNGKFQDGADELIDKVATEKDQDARMAAGIELQEYLVNACPQVPLYIANLVIAFNKDLQGQYFYGGGNHNWSHAYIAK